jgi:transcription termination factor NusB
MSQTLGQKRVKAEFNPAKNDLVDQIKNKSAELIDLMEAMLEGTTSVEKIRLIEYAQLDVETACMLAVKACFTD